MTGPSKTADAQPCRLRPSAIRQLYTSYSGPPFCHLQPSKENNIRKNSINLVDTALQIVGDRGLPWSEERRVEESEKEGGEISSQANKVIKGQDCKR